MINGGSARTTGAQTYGNAVTLGANTTLNGDGVTFGSTVKGAQTLTINGSGVTTFCDAVGGSANSTDNLTSLTVNTTGASAIKGGSVSTSGTQTYEKAVTLGQTTTLNGSGITFSDTVDGATGSSVGLTIADNGAIVINGAIGDTTPLTTLTVGSGSGTSIGGGRITTTGAQTYADPMTLTANAAFSGDTISFQSTIDGAHALSIVDAGTTTLTGAVGAGSKPTSVSIDSQAMQFSTIKSSGNISLTSKTALQLGKLNVGGDMTVTTGRSNNSGGVTQAANASLLVEGDAVFIADTKQGQVATLTNANNDFSGAVSLTAADATVTDKNALVLGSLAIAKTLDVTSTGNLTLGTGTVGTTMNNVATGALTVNTNNGNLTQQAGGITVAGTATLQAGTGTVTLADASNSFSSSVSATAAWVDLKAASALTIGSLLATDAKIVSDQTVALGTVNVTKDLEVKAADTISQAVNALLSVGGESKFDTAKDVNLTNTTNQFTGPVLLAANNVTLLSASPLVLGDVDVKTDLTLNTLGTAITQTPTAKLVVKGDTTVNTKDPVSSASGDVSLSNKTNDFVGTVTATGAAITLRDGVGEMTIGNINATGMFDARATGGPIKLKPGTLMFAKGGIILVPDPRPAGVDYPKAPMESLASARGNAVSASASSSSTARGSAVMLATDQSAGGDSGSSMIKVSQVPLTQLARNVIPVGKAIALDASAKANVIQSASFEVVDGFASGNTTIEVAPATANAVPARVDNSAGKVTLSGEASAADYDKLIQSIKLRVGDNVPDNAVFRIRITLTDQSGKTESKTVTLQLNKPDQISRNP